MTQDTYDVLVVGGGSVGLMAAPAGPDNVGWFSPGVRPGAEGSAVIAGHRGWKGGREAVFDNLSKLRTGDTLSVVDDKGITHTFVVRETVVYDGDAEAPEVFQSNGGAYLNLITCIGDWDKSRQTYSERLVVFTDSVR